MKVKGGVEGEKLPVLGSILIKNELQEALSGQDCPALRAQSDPDHRLDVFSTGCVVFFALTGSEP